tara:strand:- start:12591 stop:13889 length:1299 start_codon:yes stop_codon:yes gene_type:complete
MDNVFVGATYAKPLADLGKELEIVQDELTVAHTDLHTQTTSFYHAFGCSDTHLYCPKFYGLMKWGQPAQDRRSTGKVACGLKHFAGNLRPIQATCAQTTLKQLHDLGGAFVVLPCGYGKTALGLYVAHALGVKCIILVHNAIVGSQWPLEIKTFLPHASIGRLQQDVVDVKNKDVVICSIQTLARRNYPFMKDEFGLCIVDEAHHMAAPTFSKVTTKIWCRYILGLSATPERRDANEFVLYWICGPISFRIDRDPRPDVQVIKHKFPQHHRKEIKWKGRIMLSRMETALVKDKNRNLFLLDLIVDAMQRRQCILVVSTRRQHLQELGFALFGKDAAYLVGGMTESERTKSKQQQVIFLTYAFCSEALNIPRADTVILVTPRANVEQVVGRGLRDFPNKLALVIHDVYDPYSIFIGLWRKRLKYYKKAGFTLS